MKTRLLVVLFGLFSLLGSAAALAHSPGYGDAYAGIPLTGGITVWGDSYGNTGYAGNVSLGFAGGYANYRYAPVPYYGHMPPYCYARGYNRGYRHGHHGKRHHGKGHHGRRH